MDPTYQQLRDRWETDDGRKRFSNILEAIQKGNPWETYLDGFPWTSQIANKRDLRCAKFENIRFHNADFGEANLSDASFNECFLLAANFNDINAESVRFNKCNLRIAAFQGAKTENADHTLSDLTGAYFNEAHLSNSCFAGCWLRDAHIWNATIANADFTAADLSGAWLNFSNLRGSSFEQARLVRACFKDADISGCYVYGASAWDVCLDNTIQRDLIVSGYSDGSILTVDNIDIAQFIHLLIHNPRIRGVIDGISSKVVLILGRFTPKRKAVLDKIREELRKRNYSPVIFDFDAPTQRDLTETISTLSHLARFVIADITDAKSIPQELMAIVPNLPSVPVQPLILKGRKEYAMLEHFYRFPWFLPLYEYSDEESLIDSLALKVIKPAEDKSFELRPHQ